MPVDYLGQTTALLQGALDAQQQHNKLEMEAKKEKEQRQQDEIQSIADAVTKGAETYQKGKIAKGEQDVKREDINSQFITLTPDLAKGAAAATEDEGWNQQVGSKMRADVYSSLLSYGARMAGVNKTREVNITEGEGENAKVYPAIFDPKTNTVTKAKSATGEEPKGGSKFATKRLGASGSGAGGLNPLTLQNIVRQDEKTLLSQLGGKGAKGIPEQSAIGGLMSKITSGRMGDMSDKEKAKLATLKSLAARMKTNYANLQMLEQEKGLQPTQVDPSVMETIDKLLTTEGASGSKIPLIGIDGKTYKIPKDKVEEAIKSGKFHRP